MSEQITLYFNPLEKHLGILTFLKQDIVIYQKMIKLLISEISKLKYICIYTSMHTSIQSNEGDYDLIS